MTQLINIHQQFTFIMQILICKHCNSTLHFIIYDIYGNGTIKYKLFMEKVFCIKLKSKIWILNCTMANSKASFSLKRENNLYLWEEKCLNKKSYLVYNLMKTRLIDFEAPNNLMLWWKVLSGHPAAIHQCSILPTTSLSGAQDRNRNSMMHLSRLG